MSDYDSNDDELAAALAVMGAAGIVAAAWKGIKNLSTASEAAEVERLRQQAQTLEAEGQLVQAVQVYLELLNKAPNDAYAHIAVAWILANQLFHLPDTLTHAVNHALRAVQLAPSPEVAASFSDTLAEAYMRQGNFDQAILTFQHALNLSHAVDTEHIEYSASYRLAFCYQFRGGGQGDLRRAYEAIHRAVGLGPANPFIYACAGEICYHLASYNLSIGHYQRAVQLARPWHGWHSEELRNWTLSNWHTAIGAAYFHLKDYARSWEAHHQAYQHYPANPYAVINLAELHALTASIQKRSEEQAQARRLLELGVGLLDPNVHGDLLNALLYGPNFENMRETVLEMLLNHGKISLAQATAVRRTLSRLEQPSQPQQVINIHGSTIGGIGGHESSFQGVSVGATSPFDSKEDKNG